MAGGKRAGRGQANRATSRAERLCFRSAKGGCGMGAREAFAGVLPALCNATLDGTLWPAASARIDEALGTLASSLVIDEGPEGDLRILFAASHYRGQRREDLGQDYLQNDYPWDERMPRIRRLPGSKLVHFAGLCTDRELKTSRACNEFVLPSHGQNGMVARVKEPDGSHMNWALHNPVTVGTWEAAQIETLQRLLPHLRQFVRVRQALVGAEATGALLGGLLASASIGVIEPDGRGRILETNDPALGGSASGRRADGPGRRAERVLAGGRRQVAEPPGLGVARPGPMRHRRLDADSESLRPAALHLARQPRQRPSAGLRRAPRCRNGVDGRERQGAANRPACGGAGFGSHADGEPHCRGTAERQPRAPHCRGDGQPGRHDSLAYQEDFPQAWRLPAGEPGAPGAVSVGPGSRRKRHGADAVCLRQTANALAI